MTRRAFVLSGLLLGFWAWLAVAATPHAAPAREPFSHLPMQIGDWTGRAAPPLEASVLKVLGADDYLNRTYSKPSGSSVLGVYIGYHGSQRQGSSIHSPMNCLPGAGWLPLSTGRSTVESPNGAVAINKVTIAKGDDRQLALYWYQGQGRIIASEYSSKAYLFLDALRTSRTDAALVRIIVPIAGSDEGAALKSGQEFAAALLPLLDRFIPN